MVFSSALIKHEEDGDDGIFDDVLDLKYLQAQLDVVFEIISGEHFTLEEWFEYMKEKSK